MSNFLGMFQVLALPQSHFGLQVSSDGLNSSRGGTARLLMTDRGFLGDLSGAGMNLIRALLWCAVLLCISPLTASTFADEARTGKLVLPPGTSEAISKIYSFDTDAAIADARRLQAEHADHPLGYLLEAEALWWKIWCSSTEFKYGMTDARHRRKIAADQHYLDLAAKASSIATVGSSCSR